ncbi:MAG: hypothetical protein A2176_04645 [Spirochaetes bacterium RBG_13_51_14]|nr:MAG: hypothetical protein A2176_04645 [Spirochaetes bacterium RBG_13_51_14]
MRRISAVCFLVSVLSVFLYSCGDIDENEKIVTPKFHTESNEGLWVNESITHVPIVTFTAKNEIDVRVPLKPTKKPIHYIEAIALMDGNREIAVRKIPFSFDEPWAHFRLPDIEKGNYKVVAKCNLHDMWMAPVVIPSRSDKKR